MKLRFLKYSRTHNPEEVHSSKGSVDDVRQDGHPPQEALEAEMAPPKDVGHIQAADVWTCKRTMVAHASSGSLKGDTKGAHFQLLLKIVWRKNDELLSLLPNKIVCHRPRPR